jgi:molybdopterin-containing oxidoreductase family membrane subunit
VSANEALQGHIEAHTSDHELVIGAHTYETVTDRITSVVLDQKKHPLAWFAVFALAFLLLNGMMLTITYLLYRGVGIWGINQPAGWGFDIINFVWWIGIGHAGTLISAILLLMRQQWRTSINRFAEAMTLFAVACAGLYPLLHTGRPWVAYWLLPYPNIMGMWPQFRSPLVWDVFAVSTYMTVSALFWFVGLVPDLATLRDRARNRFARLLFGIGALGWRGSARHWSRYEAAYLMLAGLSTPLVLSVHSIVSFDFAVSVLPGWHTTVFPPYFVAGAIYAGFAMVLTLSIPIRAWYGLKDFITDKHLDWMAKIMLATGMIVVYGYVMEMFYGWYSGNAYEGFLIKNRMTGPYAPLFWALLLCNGVVPQILWSKRWRSSPAILFCVSLVVSVGMWLERFIIIPVSLHRDFLPSSWGMYVPTLWDWGMFIGTLGLFFFLMFLFIRALPMISIFEMRDLVFRLRGDKAAHRRLPVSGKPAETAVEGEGR